MASKKTSSGNLFAALGLARISVGLVFLWAFVDKLFGLGFTTCRDATSGAINTMCNAAWLQGGSPTEGFLKFGTNGPFADFYSSLAGNGFVDGLFMIGLLGIGLALTLGIATRLATLTGSLLLLMMWSAVLPPEHHPLVDEHIVYILVLAAVYFGDDNQRLGLSKWWKSQPAVKSTSLLQ